MANLIITVISIALVAVAALMGAYYGGSAFMEGQANAKANAFTSTAEQIRGAYAIRRATTGQKDISQGFEELVNENYLDASVMAICRSIDMNGGSELDDCNYSGTAGYESYKSFIVFDTGFNDNSPPAVCKKIAQMAGGPSAQPKDPNIDSTITPVTGRRFDCIYESSSFGSWLIVYPLG